MPLKNKVKKRFSKAASTYDKYADTHRQIVSYLISKTAVHTTKGNILDLGSGTGLLTEQIQNLNISSDILSLDLSFEMLSTQKEKNLSAKKVPLLIQGDIDNLPLIENSFDLIVSSTALQWSDINYIPELITNTLKKNGQFSLAIISSGTFKLLREVKQDITGEITNNFLPHFQSLKESFLNKKSLNITSSERHTFIATYKTIDELITAISSLGIGESNDRKLTDSELKKFKKNYQEMSSKKYGCPYLDYEVSFFFGNKI